MCAKKFQITATSLLQIIDMYKATLTSYGHEQLPHYQSPKSFNSRVDSLLVLMARQVINLTNLVRYFRDRMNLTIFSVRSNKSKSNFSR